MSRYARLVAADPPGFLGLDAATWDIVTGVAAAAATLISVIVAFYALRRADRREHHRWLQEKRREAYVTFMTASRLGYDAIEARARRINAPLVHRNYRPSKDEGPRLAAEKAEIDRRLGELRRAQDVLALVGPKRMEVLGMQLIARLKLDRGYYAPNAPSDRLKDRELVLMRAEETGDPVLLRSLKAVYAAKDFDFEAYSAAFASHRLDEFSRRFNDEARRVIEQPAAGSWFSQWRSARSKGRASARSDAATETTD